MNTKLGILAKTGICLTFTKEKSMYGQAGWDEVDIDGLDANGNSPDAGCYTGNGYGSEPYYDRSFAREIPKEYKWQFLNDEALITSEIFQRLLGQALEFKDKEIHALREEILEVWTHVSG
jgi:hypothetical protein